MANKPGRFDVKALSIRDNVPPGMVVSLESLPPVLSFASMFRDELMERGIGIAKREVKRGRKRLD